MATEPKKWNIAPGANADCNDIPDTADAGAWGQILHVETGEL